MTSSTSLSDEQISLVRAWAEDGDVLADIQRKLNEEMEIKVTYLETRFLLEDLKIELKPEPVPEPEEVIDEEEIPGGSDEPGNDGAGQEEAGEATIPEDDAASVTIDKIQRPGALVSGRVTFAGGHSAAWWLDQMGQLGMDPEGEAFEPNEAQLISFQKELQAAIQQSGL